MRGPFFVFKLFSYNEKKYIRPGGPTFESEGVFGRVTVAAVQEKNFGKFFSILRKFFFGT